MPDYCPTTGKIIFQSKADARSTLMHNTRSIPKRRNVTSRKIEFEAYRCEHCGGWHNSSRPKRRKF